MSKNADGWIRHRGGKCPVEKGALVDVRFRNGDIIEGIPALESHGSSHPYSWSAGIEFWEKDDVAADIMAYRLHKPAEQPYVRDERDIASDPDGILIVNPCDTLKAYKPAEQVEACSKPKVYSGTLQSLEVIEQEGPLQWRDRITEIDATTQALTTERAELVQKLASEGFALIGRINDLLTDAARKHEDMSDPKNWKEGDVIESVDDAQVGIDIGAEYQLIASCNGKFVRFRDNDGDILYRPADLYKFHSRPSA